MGNEKLKIGKRYAAIPLSMGWFNMRHKIPSGNKNFIVTIINTVEDELGKDWYDESSHISITSFKTRVKMSKTQPWIDYKIKKENEQCYIVSLENNKNEDMYEIMLDSEIIRIKRK